MHEPDIVVDDAADESNLTSFFGKLLDDLPGTQLPLLFFDFHNFILWTGPSAVVTAAVWGQLPSKLDVAK